LIIFPALKASTDGDDIGKDHTFLTIYHTAFVLVIQLYLFGVIVNHPINSSIFGVLYMLLISSTISVVEVALVSRTAAIINLIVWIFIIAVVVDVNWPVITNADLEASKKFMKSIAIICVISILWMINCIVHTLDALLYRSA
jgi:hypothetical protein